jgi:hypothetical protein
MKVVAVFEDPDEIRRILLSTAYTPPQRSFEAA